MYAHVTQENEVTRFNYIMEDFALYTAKTKKRLRRMLAVQVIKLMQ